MASRYIYQVHKTYGAYEDFVDKIVGTFYDYDKANMYMGTLVEEWEEELEQYKMCACCEYDKPCFRPAKDDPHCCRDEINIIFDEDANFFIKQIEVKDWEEYVDE